MRNLIKLHLEYYDNNYVNKDDYAHHMAYKRGFELDYINLDSMVMVTEHEFKTILHQGTFQLNDNNYSIINKRFVVESNDQYWNILIKHVDDFDSEYLPF